ncbi:MAG TPA: hypothetical protein VFB96_18220 [Pirellulaceae bacterium]|jgi:hypothetical protein|nr:hypothetical protein [Pirellulaceae bacterium]
MDTAIAETHEHDTASHFPPDEERDLRHEDSMAWHDIVKILLGIISIGVILAITCVYLTLNL